jgi:hypothetical protein
MVIKGGRDELHVFFYDKWAEKCECIQRKDKFTVALHTAQHHIAKNPSAEARDHPFCIVVAEETLLQRLRGLKSRGGPKLSSARQPAVSIRIETDEETLNFNSNTLESAGPTRKASNAKPRKRARPSASAAAQGSGSSSSTAAASKKATSRKYKYTKLAEVTRGEHHVYGVVTQFGMPKQTRGTDWMLSLSLIDESLPADGFAVNVFAPAKKDLPVVKRVGDVVRLHRVTVQLYQSQLQGLGQINRGKRTAILCISPSSAFGTGGEKRSTSSKFTFGEEDAQRVEALHKWSTSVLSSTATTTAHHPPVAIGSVCTGSRSFCDLVCQIVRVQPPFSSSPNGLDGGGSGGGGEGGSSGGWWAAVLHVWDGTGESNGEMNSHQMSCIVVDGCIVSGHGAEDAPIDYDESMADSLDESQLMASTFMNSATADTRDGASTSGAGSPADAATTMGKVLKVLVANTSAWDYMKQHGTATPGAWVKLRNLKVIVDPTQQGSGGGGSGSGGGGGGGGGGGNSSSGGAGDDTVASFENQSQIVVLPDSALEVQQRVQAHQQRCRDAAANDGVVITAATGAAADAIAGNDAAAQGSSTDMAGKSGEGGAHEKSDEGGDAGEATTGSAGVKTSIALMPMPQHGEHPLSAVPFATLRQVLHCPQVPFKFRCKVRVTEHFPSRIEGFTCPAPPTMAGSADASSASSTFSFSSPPSAAGPLIFAYRFGLRLEDGSNSALDAIIDGKDGEQLFNGVPAVDLNKNNQSAALVAKKVQRLMQDDTRVECFLASYHVDAENGGKAVRFRIFSPFV